jgi:uncharacterized protein YkwD
MMVGEYKATVSRVCVLVTALLLATATVLLMGVLTAEKPALAQSTLSGSSVITCDGGSITLNAYEMSTYELHNQMRASNGLATLCVHEALTQAARSHSQEMIDYGYFSHSSYNGESFPARLERFGYDYYEVGENIAWGSGSNAYPDSIFQVWMNSPEHRENILYPNFLEVGIGTATGEYESYSDSTMYTVDFGVRQPSDAQVASNEPQGADYAQGSSDAQVASNEPQGADYDQGGNSPQGSMDLGRYLSMLFRLLGFY